MWYIAIFAASLSSPSSRSSCSRDGSATRCAISGRRREHRAGPHPGPAPAITPPNRSTLPRPTRPAPPAASFRKEGLGAKVKELFSKGAAGDETWKELEDLLIKADVGPTASADLVQRVKVDYAHGADPVKLLATEIESILGPDESLHLPKGRTGVIMVVGVNGAGKTTTIGKLAKRLVSRGTAGQPGGRRHVPRRRRRTARGLGAHEQERNVVSQERGADPGAVAFDAVKSAHARGLRRADRRHGGAPAHEAPR